MFTIVDYKGILTRIIGVECKHTDHLTTTLATATSFEFITRHFDSKLCWDLKIVFASPTIGIIPSIIRNRSRQTNCLFILSLRVISNEANKEKMKIIDGDSIAVTSFNEQIDDHTSDPRPRINRLRTPDFLLSFSCFIQRLLLMSLINLSGKFKFKAMI